MGKPTYGDWQQAFDYEGAVSKLKQLNVEEEKRKIAEVKAQTNKPVLKKITGADYIFCIGLPLGLLGYSIYSDNSLATLMSALCVLFGVTASLAGVVMRDLKLVSKLTLHQRNTAMEMFDQLSSIKGEQIKMAIERLLKSGDVSVYVAEADDDKVTKH
jgi:hypothetical protein